MNARMRFVMSIEKEGRLTELPQHSGYGHGAIDKHNHLAISSHHSSSTFS
jgi:hypothetical protein